MKEIISTDNAPKAIGPYSQAIVVEAKKLIFVSGQIPLCPKTMTILNQDIVWQTQKVLENLQAILEKSLASLQDVVKVTIYLTDMSHFNQVNSIYEQFFGAHKPARACLTVKELPKSALIEIEAIAAIH